MPARRRRPGGGNNVLQALLAMLLSEKLGAGVTATATPRPEAEAMRNEIRSKMGTGAGKV